MSGNVGSSGSGAIFGYLFTGTALTPGAFGRLLSGSSQGHIKYSRYIEFISIAYIIYVIRSIKVVRLGGMHLVRNIKQAQLVTIHSKNIQANVTSS